MIKIMMEASMFRSFVLVCAFCFMGWIGSLQALSEPYQSLPKLLPYDDMGWYSNAEPMEQLVRERKPKVVIELGSWLGKSTRHIAQIIPKDGIVYAVDHWLGSVEHHATQFSKYLPTLYDQFLSNVIHTKLTDKIIPVRMTTLQAVNEFVARNIVPDLIYVDASHDEESVYKDLVAYYPLVKGHGILCGDDWGWGNGFPVQMAVRRFAKEQNLQIEIPNGWFWILREAKR